MKSTVLGIEDYYRGCAKELSWLRQRVKIQCHVLNSPLIFALKHSYNCTILITVEIHGSRAAEIRDLLGCCIFRVRVLPRRYVRFCKIGSMERRKIITFKKKLSKNNYLSRRYVIFKSKKVWHFLPNPRYIHREINEIWRCRKPIFIDFPLECLGFLEENPHFFALENNISPRQIIVFR